MSKCNDRHYHIVIEVARNTGKRAEAIMSYRFDQLSAGKVI